MTGGVSVLFNITERVSSIRTQACPRVPLQEATGMWSFEPPEGSIGAQFGGRPPGKGPGEQG